MKKVIIGAAFFMSSHYVFCQTQAEMNKSAIDEYNKADKKLNAIYNQIVNEYKEDTAFISNIKKAQRLWIQFRDAEIKMMYPDREPGYYGSIQPLCLYEYKKELTEERIKKLKQWLDGREEDSCSPTIRVKE
jgi:uncharacterized protein YecT (DUF1311 family)